MAHGLTTVERLDEIPGIGARAAQIIIAEIGLDKAQFPTAGHLASGAKVAPFTSQSGPRSKAGTTGKGNRDPKRLGEVATAAAKTDTFPQRPLQSGSSIRRSGTHRSLVALTG